MTERSAPHRGPSVDVILRLGVIATAITLSALALMQAPIWTFPVVAVLALLGVLALPPADSAPIDAPGRGAVLQDRSVVLSTLSRPEDAGTATGMGPGAVALALRLDDRDRLQQAHGTTGMAAIMQGLGDRLGACLRDRDAFCALPGGGFGVALAPSAGLDLGNVLKIIQRLQKDLGQPMDVDGTRVWPSVSVGFCLNPRAAALSQIDMLAAAESAAVKAQRQGAGGVSSYSVVDFPGALGGDAIETLKSALQSGQIIPFFQPQIHTATGRVSGVEALARWQHPTRGLVPPSEFLPAIEAAGLSPLLAQCMVRASLKVLVALDDSGFHVPTVAVNLSGPDLRNPRLADEIAWELDHHDLAPERLVLEILETVVAQGEDDIAVRTVARLAGMGCGIDLDDFGTGHASLANIRRFAVARLKIDRSFVTHLDQDDQQRRLVAAILSMAEQLGLSTLAEGVETAGEQVLLAQMGCEHLQGFSIARPMSSQDLVTWLRSYNDALERGEPVVPADTARALPVRQPAATPRDDATPLAVIGAAPSLTPPSLAERAAKA